mgnify:CR=1 FL=1
MKGDKEKCLDAGMDGYLARPIRMGLLLNIVNAAVRFSKAKQRYPWRPKLPAPATCPVACPFNL